MKPNVYFIFILFLLAQLTSYAQQVGIMGLPPIPSIRTCATMEQDSINRVRFPQRGSLNEFELAIQQKIEEINERQASGRTKNTTLTIPIVFHIVHNGEAVGTGTNLSLAQVQAQVEVLNEDFRRQPGTPGFNTNPVGADIEIEFCLSPVDENGAELAEPGIHRVRGNQTSWSRNQIESTLKPSTIWNPNLFYNVWTVNFSTVDQLLLGYAQFPDQSNLPGLNANGGPATTDGVVIRYTVCGSVDKGTFPIMQAPYNKGRTLVHETGHWLGLRHIWGDGPCNADDFVSDTPPAPAPNRGCPTNQLSCDNVRPMMVQNYMDYTDDACMNIFTQGQKTRMLAVLELSPRRRTLFAANLCSPSIADVPTANFTSDKALVLLGGEVNFTDLSTNFPTSWNWTFEGGDPNTSSQRNPRIVYNTPGVYRVTLTATNSLGASEPLIREAYITVSEEGLCNTASNYLPEYTPSLVKLSNFGAYSGYLTGHNSDLSQGFSELFLNSAGYTFISGVTINFGKIYTTREDATVTVTVWNALGPQRAPGAVIERKEVLLKQIIEDIEANRPTEITFDRETPLFSRPYHVGIEIQYTQNDTVAIRSSANGEATNATSWVKKQNGLWEQMAIEYGANVAMDIQPEVGVNPSVQVAASKQLIAPGAEVILNGRGASVFSWTAEDGSVQNFFGPQLIVNPVQTTTYTVTGSGLALCNTEASITIYISGETTSIEEYALSNSITISPNPGQRNAVVSMENNFRGEVTIALHNTLGTSATSPIRLIKSSENLTETLQTDSLPPGLYFVRIKLGTTTVVKKWIKQ